MDSNNWNIHAKRLLKAELSKRGVSHEELAKMLNNIGLKETKSSIDSKMSRGTFSAAFLLQCLHVVGCNNLIIERELMHVAEPIVEYKNTENESNQIY